jgi:hypothetical protein
MKRVAAIAMLAGSCLPAHAEVSDDLKFCGGLKSGAERLACYDAAARIAARTAPSRPVARAAPMEAQAAVPVKAAALDDPLLGRNPFDGYYAAVGGGYGLISGRSVFNGIDPFDSAGGGFVSAIAGRNIGFNWGIVGIEIDGRWLGETKNVSRAILTGNLDTGIGLNSYQYQNDLGAHAALRVGFTYGDTLIFAKGGAGVARVTEKFSNDTSGIHFCDPALVPIFLIPFCSSRVGTLDVAKATTWVPSAIVGIGVEQNWGPIFGRLGVDFEAASHRTTTAPPGSFFGSTADQLTWATRGSALIGVRF